jgi:hypothetical protein
MNNKNNKIIIKSSLKLGKLNEVNYKLIKKKSFLKMQPNIGQLNDQFTADYVLNVDLGLLENFVNFNQFFNVATYDQNNIVQLEINREFINNVLFNSTGFIKFDTLDANPDVVNNPSFSKLNTNYTNLNERFFEILSTKIFGDPTLKNLILNQESFYEVIDGINSVLIDTSTTTDILNTYSELPVYVIPTSVTNFNFRNTVWDFPMYLNGHILDTLGIQNNTFNGPDMGGSIITNGIYNIPIIIRFYGVSSRKIVVGGRGKNPNNILAYSYDAFDWINATLPELNKDYFRQINTCLYAPNLWLAGGLAFNDGSNNIMTSTDGITWNYNESENVVSNVLSLATNDTILVARYIIGAQNTNGLIDSPNTVLYSYNNKDWFNSPSGSELFSLGLLNVKYNGSLWVGVGIGNTGGVLGYSLDGTEWIKSTSGSKKLDMYAFDIVWNGTIWVAVGRGNSSIIYSSDGINWSISTSGTNLLNPCSAITWDGINFIAGGDSIIYSPNGINWTASNATLFSSINNISSNSIIAIASGTIINDLDQAQLAYSTDNGITWTETINTISNEQAITSTCWNGTYWLGSVISNNDGGVIIYSDDGITWENTNTDIFSPNGYCSNLSWNGLEWTAVGFNLTDNLVFTSKDGYNWTLSNASSLIVSGRCTSYADILPKILKRDTSDLIVASGSGNFDLMVSVDGLYWYGINLFFQTNAVIWIGNKWICGGPDGFGYSNDGINWFPNNTVPFIIGTVNTMYWNGFMVFAGTNNGDYSILYSFDGITWFPSFQINSILEPTYGIYSLTWANNKWVAGTINPRKQILSVIDPNSYNYNFGNDCTKTIDNDFTTSWDPVTGYNLYQLVFTFDIDTKINCLNCFCSAVDNTDNLITGIQIEYLDSSSNYQSILNTTLSLSDFTIKESLHLFEANFNLVTTNSIRISFQKSTPNQVFITEVQFFEIINSILYSIDGINWNSANSSKGRFKEQVNSIIWDGNEIVATSNSLNEDNESILNYSSDLVNWTAPSSVSNIFIANTSLSTDYRGYYNFINRELLVPLTFNVYITDLNKQEISYTFNGSIDYYKVQYIDSDAFTLLGDLSSNLVTIESSINLTNEHSYFGILSAIKNNYVNSIYFKFWSFNYTDLTVTFNDSSPNYVYTFSFSVGNLGFDNQINKSMGIGIIDSNNSLIHTFPIPISNNYYFETTINLLYSEMAEYLTDNTTYSFCIIGEYYQPDFSNLYTIRTTYDSTFLFTSSIIINPNIDPLSVNSLSLWLDGSDPNGDGTSLTDSSTINIWYDKSGYNRNAIAQSFPNSSVAIIKNNISNSLPIIRCDGTQRYFVTYPSFPNTNYTIFTVQLCNADNVRGYQRLISGSDHDFSIFVGVKGTNIGTFTGSANESWNDTNENSPSIDNMGSWKIISMVVDNSVLTPYINGTAQTTKVGTTQPFNNLYIGGANLGMDDLQYWNGDIADIMIFNETLNQTDRQNIEGYLAWKWGLQYDLPDDHPYKQELNPNVLNEININSHNNPPNNFNIDPNSLSFVKLYINSKDTENIELEENQIISITNKTNTLTSSTLRPIYSNHSIHFNQSNCYLTLDASIINNATSYCMFFAFKINSLINPTTIFYKQHDYQSTLYIKIVDGNINFHFNDINTNWDTYSNITVSINTIYILTIIWNGTNLVLRINGSLDSSNIGGNFNIPDDSSPTFTRIGSGSAWNLYDFIYCDSLISLENINILEGFLAWKWNLQVNLPFNHEYKSRKPLNTDILQFKPTSLSNLNLWLDAGDITTIDLSDNVITHWYDKSGFGNNGIAINNPLYDAINNSILFDGSSNYIVTTYTSFSPNETAFIIFNSNSTLQQALIDTNSTGGRAYQILPQGPSIANSGVNWLIYSSTQSSPNTTYIGGYNYNSNGMNLILNGTSAGSNSTNPNFSDGVTTIGSGYSGTMWYFSGTISEVIIYNTVLSQEDRQKVEGYLAWKWGLVSSLPTDHPYYSTPINPLTPNDFSPYSSGSVNTWLDGSDLSNMFADISLNTVITNNNQKIALWRDKSPNTYYFKQSTNNLAPAITLNSLSNLPLVTFNNQILESYPMPFFTSANSGGTFFFVFDSNSLSATTLLGYQNQISEMYNDTETFIGYSFDNRTNRFGFSRNSGMSTNTNNITIDSSYNLISSVIKNSGGSPSNILINKNGNSESVGNISSGYYSADNYPYQNNSVLVTIGGAHVRGSSENLFQSGNIAEVIWFNYQLSTSEIQKIEGYLAWKWGLQSNLPIIHPFKLGSPTLQLKYAEFSPLSLANLNLWLDAKDSWYDKSGKGLIVTAYGSPTLTEDNLFSFNGTDQYFSVPYSGDHSTETGFVIIKFNNTLGEQDIICGDNGGRKYHNYNGDIRIASAGVTGGITNPASPPEISTLALLEYTITPSEIKLYQNGTLLSTTAVTITMGNESFINIGVNFALSSNTYFNGYIGEIILFNSVLSDIDRNKVEGYLAWKWEIQTSLPNDHPYKNYITPPQLLPLPDQNVNISITLSDDTPHLNDTVTFTAVINGIYKFVSSTWTINSTIVSKNTGFFTTTFNEEINYTIEYTLITVNNTYTASYSLSLLSNLPQQLPNLTVWLDGTDNTKITLDSSGNITQWTDKSINGYQFTGSNVAPNRSNLSAHFYGQNNYFTYDPSVFNNASTYTFMMVAEFGNLSQYLMCKQHDGVNSEIVLGLGQPGLTQPPATPGILYWNTYTQGSFANSTTPLEINKKYIIVITYDGNNLIFRINGQIYSTTVGDFKIIDDLGANLPWLGNWSYGNTNNDWKLYDFMYTNSVTSMIEIIKMEGSFAGKWNLQSDLPSDHPYKSSTPESISFNSFSPNSFSGLNLWLDASHTSSITLSDSNVTMWNDRRNNGISAMPGISPTYNSVLKGIQFNRVNQYMNLPDGILPNQNSSFSYFIVMSNSNIAAPGNHTESLISVDESTGNKRFYLGLRLENGLITVGFLGYNESNCVQQSLNIIKNTIIQLYYNGTTMSVSNNFTLPFTQTFGARNQDITPNKIGSGAYGFFGGVINEIIIYNKQLTTDERVQIEGYLAWKWNLQNYLPNNHNFKNISPNDLDLNVTISLSVDNENPILGDTVNLTVTKTGYYPLVSENWTLNGNIVASNTLSYSQTYLNEGEYLLSYNLNTVNGSYTQEFNKTV